MRPGDPLDIAVVLLDDDGHEVRRNIRYNVPIGAPVGPLYFTVGDAATINASEQKFLAVTEPRPSSQIIQAINSFRGNKQRLRKGVAVRRFVQRKRPRAASLLRRH